MGNTSVSNTYDAKSLVAHIHVLGLFSPLVVRLTALNFSLHLLFLGGFKLLISVYCESVFYCSSMIVGCLLVLAFVFKGDPA